MTGCNGEEDTDVRPGGERGSSGGTSESFTCQKQYLVKNKLWAAVAGHPEREE